MLVVVCVLHGAGHPRGLVTLVVGVIAGDALTTTELAPQALGLAAGVVRDDSVGGVQDALRAAVVLVEHDRGDVWERILELHDVAQICAAKAVDRVVHEHAVGDVVVRGIDFEVVHISLVRLEIDLVHDALS